MDVNLKQFIKKTEYYHLIVETKATFMAFIDTLPYTEFTSLIFGSGWKIVSNPIVYSCRLRAAGNASSQIMTKEREFRRIIWS